MDRKILVVEDEKAIADILVFNLQREGYETMEANDGPAGLSLALDGKPDLVLLDVMLPGLDGFEVCRRLREKSAVPVIMLTAREEETDKVTGLELGADDYITKPFSMRELMARVKANMRRAPGPAGQTPAQAASLEDAGSLVISKERGEVFKNGQAIDLTVREFELLTFLAAAPDHVFTREELMEKVWGYEYYGDLRAVDVAVRRLREKIEDNPAEPAFVLTRRGLGYYFSAAKR